jgi:predicted nucleic acid-binding protein
VDGLLAQRARLITTDLVIAETVVVLRVRGALICRFAPASGCWPIHSRVEWVERALMDDAWRLYRKYREHTLSLCDCDHLPPCAASMSRRRSLR